MPPTATAHRRSKISLLAVWIVFCAFCNCIGWLLSGFHELNAAGYATAFGIALLSALLWKAKTGAVFFERRDLHKLQRRFRRLFPAAFLILAALAFLGGALYAPTNYDALAYREPRVLHWLAEGRWHWIHTEFGRINTRGCGIEWLTAPVIVLMNTDRWLFILNSISFLFLPGLIFSIFTRLGVRPRVAWYWMWPLSCSYCFLLQAGSIANDLFVAPFVLAAVDYALRSHQQKSLGALRLSILSAALFTAVKANTLPLLLPYVIALAPGWRLWFRGFIGTLLVSLMALMASFAPIAFLNAKYAHDWTGGETKHLPSKSAFAEKLCGNLVILLVDDAAPPLAPFAGWWNNHVAANLAQTHMGKVIDANFEISNNVFYMSEMATEEGAGMGLGNFILICAATIAALCYRRSHAPGVLKPITLWFFVGTYVAFFVFITTSYVLDTARLLAPYYPLSIMPFLIFGGQSTVVRRRWWRALGIATFIIAAVPLIASPPRPLFPWKSALAWLQKAGCPKTSLERAETVYSVYSQRHNSFAPAIQLLPPGTNVVGLVTYDDPEAALWYPLGSRRVIHVCHQDSGEYLKSRGIEYVIVNPNKLDMFFHIPFDQWLQEVHGRQVAILPLTLRASGPTLDWPIVKLD